MKEIFKKIFVTLIAALFTALIIALVVVPNPTWWLSYLFLSFILIVDALVLICVLPVGLLSFIFVKEKPKTVSVSLVLWLALVAYCGAFASACLTDAYISSGAVVALVFDCIFAAFAAAAVAALIRQFAVYCSLKLCLKYGKEATAEFVSFGKSITFEYGKSQSTGFFSVTRYSVHFKYSTGDNEITAKSRRVFTYKQVEKLRTMHTFRIKYNKRTAVINETV